MNRLRKLSLIRQIQLLGLMMLAVLLVSFIISNKIAEQTVERKVSDSVDKLLLQAEEKLTSFYSNIESISIYLLYSPTIQNLMDSKDMLSVVLMNNEVTSMLGNTMSINENIRGIKIFKKDGSMAASIGENIDYSVRYPVQTIEYSGIVSTNDHKPYYIIEIPVYNLKSTWVKEYRGTCVFIMDANNFNNILKNAIITPHSRFLLLDQHDQIIASEGSVPQLEPVNIKVWENDKRLIVQSVNVLPQTGWRLINAIPKDELLQDLDTVQKLNITTYVIMIGIFVGFQLIFFTRIMNPIKALMDFMKSYPKMGGSTRFHILYHNEIGVFASNLNNMLDEIDNLGKQVHNTQKQMYDMEITKKQMEISAYRNQINPHFLYNTLECIRAMAFYYKTQDIADITASLSNMFRYAIKGDNFVTIRDEISHVREYAQIIGFRFMGRIRVEIDVEESLLEKKTLKMLLQPIVENAVFHGLEKKIDHGVVQIKIHSLPDDKIQITIMDNGQGMDETKVAELLYHLRIIHSAPHATTDKNQEIGLSNIFKRIKLFYGDMAEMNIQSELNTGTTIRISIPVHNNGGDQPCITY